MKRGKLVKRVLCILVAVSFLLPANVVMGKGGKRPDLWVEINGDIPAILKEGEIITITARVDNVGCKDAKNFGIKFSCDTTDNTIKTKSVASLPVNTFINVSINWVALAGNHTLIVEVDFDDVIDEADETNNINEIDIYVENAGNNIENSTQSSFPVDQSNYGESTESLLGTTGIGVTKYPTDDTFARSWKPSTVYGGSTYFTVNPRTQDICRTYIKFDLSSIPSGATVSSAKLRMYYYRWWEADPAGRTNDLHEVANSWNENTLTWNNKPNYDATAFSSYVVPSSFGWIDVDVTQYVQDKVNGEPNYGILIKDRNEQSMGLNTNPCMYSKEYGSYCPRLVIGYTTGLSLGEAVDNTDLTWSTGGNANWFGQTQTYYYGGDAAQSGDISDNQNTWIKTTVGGQGTLKFYWKVSSETNYDYLRFYIDSSQQTGISGNVDWQQKTYSISSGSHELMWKYTKDGSVSSGSDCGWLDKVEWIAEGEVWQQMIGDETGLYENGFGRISNIATRGMDIYDGKLFIGTENLNKLRTVEIFSDGFEDDLCENVWSTETTWQGRVRVSTSYPHSGSYSVLLDDSVYGAGFSYARLILTVHLNHFSDVELEFWWREFGDEDHAGDGVFISDDGGSTWYKAFSFNNGPQSYTRTVIDIDAKADEAGMEITNNFKIKFQFYDNCYIPYDGYAIDDVKVTGYVDSFIGEATPEEAYMEDAEEEGPIPCSLQGSGGISGIDELLFHYRALASDGCEVWYYDANTGEFHQVIGDNPEAYKDSGFGDTMNYAAATIKEFKGKLYVGTANSPDKGCEVWRYDGSSWEQVVGNEPSATKPSGFGNKHNLGAWSIEEYDGYLYIGTMNWHTGCQIYRSYDGTTWNQVPLTEEGDGFGDKWNTYAWDMEVYQDELYVSTFNFKYGCELWKYDGSNWYQLVGNDPEYQISGAKNAGFGEVENYGIRNMKVYGGELYAGTATSIFQTQEACEIWKYDGSNWHPVIGDDTGNPETWDGFGKTWNKYAWSMNVTSDNKLWVGTVNIQRTGGIPLFETEGCEIWCYDGSGWSQKVGDESGEIGNGFNDKNNSGARSMIEYPTGSGDLWVGTFHVKPLLIPDKGCEVWKRTST
ncbi:MAG: DNRLRE domain-containing protein [Candidatus Thermoplasmatota archaeon]|nr:DNRLRE domain-containing protein [Candidatus Thermoplasmatota archaeon]